MVSTVLEMCTLFGAALLTACALDVAVLEKIARSRNAPLPRRAEWSALCGRVHWRLIWPAALSVIASLAVSATLSDDRWQVGAGLMMGAMCYAWAAILPAGTVLRTIDPTRATTLHLTRARFKAYALRHYPLVLLGLAALVAFAWAHH